MIASIITSDTNRCMSVILYDPSLRYFIHLHFSHIPLDIFVTNHSFSVFLSGRLNYERCLLRLSLLSDSC